MAGMEGWAVAASVATVLGVAWSFLPQMKPVTVSFEPSAAPPVATYGPASIPRPAAVDVRAAEAPLRRLFDMGVLGLSTGFPSSPESGRRWIEVRVQSALVSYGECELRYKTLLSMTDTTNQVAAYETETTVPLADLDGSLVQLRQQPQGGDGPNIPFASVQMLTRGAQPTIWNRILQRSPIFGTSPLAKHQAAIFVPDEANGTLLRTALEVLISACGTSSGGASSSRP